MESHGKAPLVFKPRGVKGGSRSRQPEGQPPREACDGRGRASCPASPWARPLPAASERNARGRGLVKDLKPLGLVSGHPRSENRLSDPTHVVPAHDAHASLIHASGEALEPPDGAISNDFPQTEDQFSGK